MWHLSEKNLETAVSVDRLENERKYWTFLACADESHCAPQQSLELSQIGNDPFYPIFPSIMLFHLYEFTFYHYNLASKVFWSHSFHHHLFLTDCKNSAGFSEYFPITLFSVDISEFTSSLFFLINSFFLLVKFFRTGHMF